MPAKLEVRKKQFDQIDLYPVITSEFCANRSVLDVIRQVLAGGAKIIQLREKNCTKKELFDLAEKARRLTQDAEALLIINDHVDIALSIEADGVHLGQDDLPLSAARKIAPELILGISTHSLAEAQQAGKEGADYINIGPVFSTQTKAHLSSLLGVEQLKEIANQIAIPFTVMGGIKQDNIQEVLQAGAKKIAMVTEITQANDITEQVALLRRRIQEGYK